MDRADLALLHQLQVDARTPVDALADLVGLSPAACYKRIQRLRSDRRIVREAAVVHPRTMGWSLTLLVMVTLERERGEVLDRFVRKIQDTPEILDAYYVTGDYDFVLVMVAQDMESFEARTRTLLYADHDVKGFKTLVTMRRVKERGPVPAAASASGGEQLA